MVKNNMPCQQLVTQHRMRPCISSLLVPTIYKMLKDGPKVKEYEDIRGVRSNMYFISHNYTEGNQADSFSKSNIHEATFLIKLARYFIQQGYKSTQITILATYSGQTNSLKKLAKAANLSDVCITSVDNYQGEENDILLISLVRSNTIGSIGFLDISNRVCVALSRAKKGLYCIGNFNLLTEQSDLWKAIVKKLEDMDAIGVDLRLFCELHPDTFKDVCREPDFDSVPEGGCTRLCKTRLPCGHACNKCCHPYDKTHELYQCKEKCQKKTCKLHCCPKFCFQCTDDENGCGPCIVRVNKTLSCCHEVMMACSVDPKDQICRQDCGKVLNCGHFCCKPCGEECESKCRIQVKKTPLCGHVVNIECYKSNKSEELLKKCSHKCGGLLNCGHSCQGSCGSCYQGRLHMPCKEKCDRLLFCGHTCTAPCSATCPACTQPCMTKCPHSTCKKLCGVPCEPCNQRCAWRCKHKICRNKCSEPCSRGICDEPCDKKLKCGHPCIGFCGETCPKVCKKCSKEITEIQLGFEDEPDAKFVVLPCKKNHVIESKGLFKCCTTDDNVIRMIRCPICREIIPHNHMLGEFIKRACAGVERVKEKVFGLKDENSIKLRNLKISLKSLSTQGTVNRVFIKTLKAITEQIASGPLESGKLVAFQNFLIFIERLDEAEGKLWECSQNILTDMKVYTITLNEHLSASLTRLVSFMTENCERPNQQHSSDLDIEVYRYETVMHLVVCVDKAGGLKSLRDEMRKKFKEALALLLGPKIFSDSARKVTFNILQDLKRCGGAAAIGVSDIERKEIISAVGLLQGHWYQCPNGHVYCIGECGGAIELGKCNECQAQIGGVNHALLMTNRVASDMDGARFSAWSDAANMNNYDLNDLVD